MLTPLRAFWRLERTVACLFGWGSHRRQDQSCREFRDKHNGTIAPACPTCQSPLIRGVPISKDLAPSCCRLHYLVDTPGFRLRLTASAALRAAGEPSTRWRWCRLRRRRLFLIKIRPCPSPRRCPRTSWSTGNSLQHVYSDPLVGLSIIGRGAHVGSGRCTSSRATCAWRTSS